MKPTKISDNLDLIVTILLILSKYGLPYSTSILEYFKEYKFFKFVSLDNVMASSVLSNHLK